MAKFVLVTGGAGFIGSHLVDALVDNGHRVRVFDNLEPQVHGNLAKKGQWPDYVNKRAEYVYGDVRDRTSLSQALQGVEVIFHQAAMVGVGQSMYQVERYVDVNSRGTAVLLDILANDPAIRGRLSKLVVASSMSIYGEGMYRCREHGPVFPELRDDDQLARRSWEMRCPRCDRELVSQSTTEEKPLQPNSVYAVSKKDQEELALSVGRAYGVPTVALRYFNTYGQRQALSNPYTGVAAIFCSRLLNDQPPVIFEDGLQSRDFVHVSDIVQANLLALEREAMNDDVFNVGTGRSASIIEISNILTAKIQPDMQPEIVSSYRTGDIRHCYSNIEKIKQHGYRPEVPLEDGLRQLAEWVKEQSAIDSYSQAQQELILRGLAR